MERLKEKIEIFCDADRRNRLTEEEMEYCPTVAEVMKVLDDEA